MAKITIDVSAKFVVFRVTGNASFNELIVAIEEHYPSIIHPNIIWNFTEGALPKVTANQFRKIPAIVKDSSSRDRKVGLTAFVCPDDATYGMFRLYITHAEIGGLPYQYNVYRRFEDAANWMNEE